MTKKYNFAILSGEKICFDGFWEAESQYLGAGGDERGRIEGIVSGGREDINPTLLPSPSMIQHPISSNITKFPYIYASGC